MQRAENSQDNSEEQVGQDRPSDIKIYYTAIGINIIYYWYKDK